jgi:hypothetical protein
MKLRHFFARPNSVLSHVRVVIASVLVISAVAMASVAVKTSSPRLTGNTNQKREVFNKFRQDRDAVAENALAIPGPGHDGGPLAAAEEKYRLRAYPAKDIPFKATVDARKAWNDIKAKNEVKAKSSRRTLGSNQPLSPVGAWTLVGPSMANFPDVLTFSGAPYTTSGRITALIVDPTCSGANCRVWAAAAGGGVWRTLNALDATPTWTFISGSFATNAIGALTYRGGVLYAGTGEPNASGDSEAGWGVYKSTDGGDSWTLLNSTVGPITTTSPGGGGTFAANGTYTGNAFAGRAISSIVVDPTNPNHLYVSSVRAVRGIASTGGATSNPTPPRPPFGLFESTDGGATFKFIWDGSDACPATCDGSTAKATVRGVNEVALDPGWNGTSNKILYGSGFGLNNPDPGAGGVWRSTDAGTTWTQIKTARNAAAALNTDRAEFAVTTLPSGATRMYVGIGNSSISASNVAHLFRTDDARAATPAFTDLTAAESPAGQTSNYCGDPAVGGAQCWYDNVVYSPPGKPNVVYLGGSYAYTTYGGATNGRAFLRSTNAGVSFTDMTWDATTDPTPPGSCCQGNSIAPNGQHPDSHAMVEIPGSDQAIFGGDGGLMRSSGAFANISGQCTANRGLTGANLALCQQLLSSVPTLLTSINNGLSTLQFQSLSVAADNSSHVQGGTQDNGTFETTGSTVTWPQIIYGDGGQSGFNIGNSAQRLNSFTSNFHDVNFQNGSPTKWVIASGPIVASGESALFYSPIISDPAVAGTIFEGSQSVWRTQDWAGNQAFLEANCPEFTTSGAKPTCGDFVAIGPAGATNLTASAGDYRGTARSGGNVSFVARNAGDTGTLWVATTTGRVFISKNADTAAGSVTYTRLDSLAVNSPGRFISGIYVDPADGNHAWISYSGYAFNTPAQPGHIFSVVYNPGGGTAAWNNIDGAGVGTMFPDFPATAVVADSNGDVYAANDWGVLRLPNGSANWEVAGTGLPQVEICGLTIAPGARKLYAATHGRSAWRLNLPLELVSAASRLTHGGAGTFDVNLPLSDTPGIECRNNSGNFLIVLHFNNTLTLTAGTASVTGHNPPSGSGSVSGVTISGNDLLVNLSGVSDKQILTLTATGITDVNGTVLPSVSVDIGFLIGDTTANKVVNASDVTQTKAQSGSPVTSANFREDVTVNGSIGSGDISLVKSKSGNGLP